MSSDDEFQKAISSAAEGVAKGALDWTSEQIKGLIKKFKNKELAFIEDIETIDLAKEQRKLTEFAFFSQYVKDKKLRILFQMGLTLRQLENDKKDFRPLKKKIINKYRREGLHIAHAVQNGIFSKYIGNVIERVKSPQRLASEMQDFFENIDQNVVFIQKTDKLTQKSGEIVAKIHANSPETFVISSSNTEAMGLCRKIKTKVVAKVSNNYSCELWAGKDRTKEIYFLNLIEDEEL